MHDLVHAVPKPAQEIKVALCARTLDLDLNVGDVQSLIHIDSNNFKFDTQLVNRAICEEEPALKQLLPYLLARVLRNGVYYYFTYKRGKGGGEAKLHDKLSIGLGGHVDIEPAPGQTLMDLLSLEAAREFHEECSVHIDPSRFDFTHFICDPLPDGNTVPVGSVHLGILAIVDVTEEEALVMTGEDSIVTNPRWMTHADLCYQSETLITNVYDRLENWSRMLVDALAYTTMRRYTHNQVETYHTLRFDGINIRVYASSERMGGVSSYPQMRHVLNSDGELIVREPAPSPVYPSVAALRACAVESAPDNSYALPAYSSACPEPESHVETTSPCWAVGDTELDLSELPRVEVGGTAVIALDDLYDLLNEQDVRYVDNYSVNMRIDLDSAADSVRRQIEDARNAAFDEAIEVTKMPYAAATATELLDQVRGYIDRSRN